MIAPARTPAHRKWKRTPENPEACTQVLLLPARTSGAARASCPLSTDTARAGRVTRCGKKHGRALVCDRNPASSRFPLRRKCQARLCLLFPRDQRAPESSRPPAAGFPEAANQADQACRARHHSMTWTLRGRDLHDGGNFPHKLIRRDGLAIRQHVLLSNLAGLGYQYPRVRPHAWPAPKSARARAGACRLGAHAGGKPEKGAATLTPKTGTARSAAPE